MRRSIFWRSAWLPGAGCPLYLHFCRAPLLPSPTSSIEASRYSSSSDSWPSSSSPRWSCTVSSPALRYLRIDSASTRVLHTPWGTLLICQNLGSPWVPATRNSRAGPSKCLNFSWRAFGFVLQFQFAGRWTSSLWTRSLAARSLDLRQRSRAALPTAPGNGSGLSTSSQTSTGSCTVSAKHHTRTCTTWHRTPQSC